MLPVGSKVGIVKIKNLYDDYVMMVIGDRFDEIERERGAGSRRKPRQYKVIQLLPTVQEYQALKAAKFTTSVSDLISDGYAEIETVAGELRDWYDNMGENLQQSGKAGDIESAASSLEEHTSAPNVPEICAHIKVVRFPALNATSRSARLSDAADMLNSAKEGIEQWLEENQPENEDEFTFTVDTEEKKGVEIKVCPSDLTDLAGEIENAASEVEGVEIPGMYG